MPSFRDLKGRSVDEVVASRDVPGLPDAGEQMAERAAVRAAVERIEASRGQSDEPEPSAFHEVTPPRIVPTAPVAKEVEAALQQMEAAVAEMVEASHRLTEAARLVRSLTEKDAGRLKVLLEAIRQVE